jgi:hypothetical protein
LRNTDLRQPPPLRGMTRLLHLDLTNTAIEDFDASDLESVEYLGLAGTRICDPVLAALASLPNLLTLDLERNVNVSDAGIACLKRARLPKLTRIYLWKTGVTEAGARALAAEFPGAGVYRTPEAIPAGDPENAPPSNSTPAKRP